MFAQPVFMPAARISNAAIETHGVFQRRSAAGAVTFQGVSLGAAAPGKIAGAVVFVHYADDIPDINVTIGETEVLAHITQRTSSSTRKGVVGVYTAAHDQAAADIKVSAKDLSRVADYLIAPFSVTGHVLHAPHAIAATNDPRKGVQVAVPANGASLYVYLASRTSGLLTWQGATKTQDDYSRAFGLVSAARLESAVAEQTPTIKASQQVHRFRLTIFRVYTMEAMVGLSWW